MNVFRLRRAAPVPLQPLVVITALALLCGAGSCRRSADPEPAPVRTTRTEVRELAPAPGALALPGKAGSVKFAVIGDSGRGDKPQREVAEQMVA